MEALLTESLGLGKVTRFRGVGGRGGGCISQVSGCLRGVVRLLSLSDTVLFLSSIQVRAGQ